MSTTFSQQILYGKVLLIDKKVIINNELNLKPITTCHLEFVLNML